MVAKDVNIWDLSVIVLAGGKQGIRGLVTCFKTADSQAWLKSSHEPKIDPDHNLDSIE